MIRLPLPNINNTALLDTIISNKRKENRDALMPFVDKIKERYVYYERNFNNLQAIIPLYDMWDSIKNELHSCYGSNVSLSSAKKELMAAMPVMIQNKCPYCMLSRPNTLDHYFDKSDYPEFSVFIPNLVCCCSECNSQKGTSVFSSDGKRMYIHFYHDILPEYQFLFIRFASIAGDIVPEINIFLNFPEQENLESIIMSHFSRLNLLKKYKESINDKLSVIMRETLGLISAGKSYEEIQSLVEIRYQSMVEHYGYNYWESCIYEGVINSPGFLESLIATAA